MERSFSQRLRRSVGQLALALLNATLLLSVVVLLLALTLSNKVERIAQTAITTVKEAASDVSPLADQVSSLRDEIEKLRREAASLRTVQNAEVSEVANALLVKVNDLDTGLSVMNERLSPIVEQVSTDPGILIEHAIEKSIVALADEVKGLSGCVPSS